MYERYKEMCRKGLFVLGDVFEYVSGNEHVYNLGTQKDWKTKADLTAIEIPVGKMFELASERDVKSIAIP